VAVRLRLTRVGKKKQPHYRVVAADSRSPRDGRFIEIIGTYMPRSEPSAVKIDGFRALHWLRHGAQPSERVRKLLEIEGIWAVYEGKAPESSLKVDEPAAETTETPAAPPAAESAPAPEEPVAAAPEPEEAVAEEPAAEEAVAEEAVAEASEPEADAAAEEAVAEEAVAEEAAAEESETTGAEA
jgi:small subunit ribosomal protein S16